MYGWGSRPAAEHRQYLLSLGVSASSADWMITYLDQHGPLLQQWGVDEVVADMIRTLHDGSW
eukprot:9502948-Pyramimonas_sp.AAC.1